MRPGWYADSSGTPRWWSRETGWTQDVLSPSGVPTIDPGPSPVTPPIGPPEVNSSTPLSSAGRGSLQREEPVDPFPRVLVGSGGLASFVFLFAAAALISRNLGHIMAVAALAVLVTGVVCARRLRDPGVDVGRHATILLVCGAALLMPMVGLIGIGFALAARSATDRELARRRLRHGWAGMGIAGGVIVLIMLVLSLLDGTP
ncbi:hypothetical protein GCM10011581_42970 [Saccharopolyspora subtropica]|uniref:Uncharacterized protein n=1 Tax=Saccharopolyspora thermophila TaxID=89367 RepID=A0A917K5U9_9PSEU|nr:hypothetical protein [Saccharopolyspora subtropica]GGJ01169.1 hypothetical protein GCM10011581_42970 [Saccharopolyspora subtropica]